MTDQTTSATLERSDHESEIVGDAVAVIDEALGRMMQRDLVSSGEVADLLLDVRSLLTGRTPSSDPTK